MVEAITGRNVMNAETENVLDIFSKKLITKYRNIYWDYYYLLTSPIAKDSSTLEGLKKGMWEMEERGLIMHKFLNVVKEMLESGTELSLPGFLQEEFLDASQRGGTFLVFEGCQIGIKINESEEVTLVPVVKYEHRR